MKIKIINPKCYVIDGNPVKVGDVVDADSNTTRNLIKKGFAEAADSESKRVNLDRHSRQSASQARAHVTKILDLREKEKQAAAEERKELAA